MLTGYGEALGLLCAFVWALNGLIIRRFVTAFPPAFLNALRCAAAAVLAWALMPFEPPLSTFQHVTGFEWALLAGSVLLAIGVGDTLYMVALREIGIARSLALSGTFPLPTLFFEWLLFDHAFSPTFVLGCGVVVAGVVFLSGRERAKSGNNSVESSPRASGRRLGAAFGTVVALSASVTWGLGTLMTTRAIANLTAIQANCVRLPLVSAMLFLTLRATGYRLSGRLNRRSLFIIAGSGVLGMGLGSFLYLEALHQIGAAKTTTLAATSPLFGLILAMLIFGEKADLRTLAGVVLCILGVWLVL